MARRAKDIVKAVNTLLDFSSDDQEALLDVIQDQEALLDVIQDYFCKPDPLQEDEEDENPEDSLDHEDEQATLELEGTLQHQYII